MWMWDEDKMVPASNGYQDNIRTVQKQTQKAGEKQSPFQVEYYLFSSLVLRLKTIYAFLFTFLLIYFSFPAKKLVHQPKESTNQTRTAAGYFYVF